MCFFFQVQNLFNVATQFVWVSDDLLCLAKYNILLIYKQTHKQTPASPPFFS